MFSYPPRILRRCSHTRLEYYGGLTIPSYNRLEYYGDVPNTRLEYYGGVPIPA